MDSFVKLSVNLNCRDKSVKILQYGSRLILGYYSKMLQPNLVEIVQSILGTCSLGRRSFRLLKSINHIQLLVSKLNKLSKSSLFLSVNDITYVLHCIEAFEQLCWALFFLYDNIIFCTKIRILNLNSQRFEAICFPCWFAADTAMFCKSIVSLYDNYQREKTLKNELSTLESLHVGLDGCNNDNNLVSKKYGTTRKYSNGKFKIDVDRNININNVKNFLNKKKTSCENENGNKNMRNVSFQMENVGSRSSAASTDTRIESFAATEEQKECDTAGESSNFDDVSDVLKNSVNEARVEGLRRLKVDRSGHATDRKNRDSNKKSKDRKSLIDDNGSAINKSNKNKNKLKYKTNHKNEGKKVSVPSTNQELDHTFHIVIDNDGQISNYDYVSDDEANQYLKSIIDSSEEEVEELFCGRKDSTSTDTDIDNNISIRDSDNSNNDNHIDSLSDSSSVEINNDVTNGGEKYDETNNLCYDSIYLDASKNDMNLNVKYESVNGDDIDINSYHDESFESVKMEEIRVLREKKNDLYWRIFKAIIDMGVSGSFNAKLPIKRVLGEGAVGVLGVISASMVIYEEYKKG